MSCLVQTLKHALQLLITICSEKPLPDRMMKQWQRFGNGLLDSKTQSALLGMRWTCPTCVAYLFFYQKQNVLFDWNQVQHKMQSNTLDQAIHVDRQVHELDAVIGHVHLVCHHTNI